jgi:hypothetical protein
VLSSIFALVRSKIDFQVDEFSHGQVTTLRLPEAFDGSCAVLGTHDVRYKLEVIFDRAFHPPRYRPTKPQSAGECGASAPFGFGGLCGAAGVFRDWSFIALTHIATACTVASPHPGLRARSL